MTRLPELCHAYSARFIQFAVCNLSPKEQMMPRRYSNHGGFDSTPAAAPRALVAVQPGLAAFTPRDTPFGYLFPNALAGGLIPADDPAKVVKALTDLADAMVDTKLELANEQNSAIPAGYTYWG
ncbi:MAG TPA: hypothetical protein PKE45_11880, partial [Caldilineaceae bacterium]|nr:hypothetical protein [Caldilineaceae bacterium]